MLTKFLLLMKKIAYSLLVLTIIYSCVDEPQNPEPVELQTLPVVQVYETSAQTTVQYPATIEGVADVEIRPQVSGTLEQIYVDEGSYVKKGQSMLKINEQPYREALNKTQASLNAAYAELLQSELEIEKLTPLVVNEVVSPYQLKTAEANKKVVLARLNQAKALVASAEINLGYTNIKAPVNGYLGRFPKKQGSIVSPTDINPLTTLSDVHEIHAYFALGEKDFFRYKKEWAEADEITLMLADGQTYPEKGKIDMISGQFDEGTGTITLRATFSNTGGVLRSGNTGKIQLRIPHQNVILVPQQATLEVQDKMFVFLVDKNNAVSRQPIEVIGSSGENYLVHKGLATGNRIVFKGFDYLVDGTVIKPEKMEKILAKN